jgi:hypothetical protein
MLIHHEKLGFVRSFVSHFRRNGRFGREWKGIVLDLGVLFVHSEGFKAIEEIKMKSFDIIKSFKVRHHFFKLFGDGETLIM